MLPEAYGKRYKDLVHSLKLRVGLAQAMEIGVGSDRDFEYMGFVERAILIEAGLQPQDYLIDVGCGSGRLAKPLSDYLTGSYLGLDVVPDFLTHARSLVNRPTWRFEMNDGQNIPERDEQVDMVCFFSVITHILYEHAYLYLRESQRVLKSGGKIVFSFLDLSEPSHWPVFEATVEAANNPRPPVIFLSVDAIQAWATHLDLAIEAIVPPSQPYVDLKDPIRMQDGQILQGPVLFGQSLCILRKR